VKTTLERELKLDPPEGFELPLLAGDELEARDFTSTYYDTPKRSLTRAGITLRRRVEDGVSRWQLKLPRGENSRSEIEVPGGPSGLPQQLGELLTAHLVHGRVEPVATLRTRRNGVRVVDGSRAVAEVTLDVVDILDGGRAPSTFTELEVELVDGDEQDLEQLGRTLRLAGAARSDGRPKVMRALGVVEDETPSDKRPIDRIRRLLTVQLRELEAHDPGVRTGDDPEDLHRFRVATRRTRAIVRATKPLLGTTLADLAVELKWLAGLLGPVRDLDVLLERLRAETALLGDEREAAKGLVASFESERRERREELLTALRSPRYTALLRAFADAIASLAAPENGGKLKPLAAMELQKLRKAASELDKDPSDEQLHAVRIRAKRARYAAELVESKKVERYVDALKELQDVVGEHQDAVVAVERFRAAAARDTAVAAGRLIEREHARRRECRAAFPAALERALRRGRKALG
jgi:CHAD domain-containing protein